MEPVMFGTLGGKWIGQMFWRDTRFWMITAFWRGFPKNINTLDDEKVETCKNCRHWSFLMCASLAALINDLPLRCFVCIQIHPPKKSLHLRFSDIECPADCVAAIYNVLSRRRESRGPWLSWAPGKGYHSLEISNSKMAPDSQNRINFDPHQIHVWYFFTNIRP